MQQHDDEHAGKIDQIQAALQMIIQPAREENAERRAGQAAGGKANAALIALLAKAWRVPKTGIEVVAGAASRNKRLALAGDGPALAARIAAWRKEHDV